MMNVGDHKTIIGLPFLYLVSGYYISLPCYMYIKWWTRDT